MKHPATFLRRFHSGSAGRLILVSLLLFFGCAHSGISRPHDHSDGLVSAAAEMPECGCCVLRDVPPGTTHRAVLFPERTGVERVVIRGVIYESDGRTPARGTVMYFYHTDETGRYTKRGDEPRNSFAWWHGKQRGWLRTNERGEYEIDTIKPAPYPENTEPAHIHPAVKSPSQKHCYNIADFVFRDDKLLDAKFWQNTADWWRSMGVYQNPNYGGVKLTKTRDGVWEGRRDITLFPEFDLPKIASGRDIMEESPAFEPQHAWGVDKGSHACPMCKYGYHPGVLYWVNADSDPAEIENWAKWLEDLSVRLGDGNFKAYLIYTNPQKLAREQLETKLAALGRRLDLKKIAVTYVPSVDDRATDTYLNRINPGTRNTFIVYNNRKVADKFVDLAFDRQNMALLETSVKRAGREKELYAHKY